MTEILSSVSEVMQTVMAVFGEIATAITSTPLLLLFAVAIPVISFGVGLLVRVLNRT